MLTNILVGYTWYAGRNLVKNDGEKSNENLTKQIEANVNEKKLTVSSRRSAISMSSQMLNRTSRISTGKSSTSWKNSN